MQVLQITHTAQRDEVISREGVDVMSEKSAKTQKKSWFKGLKAEFGKVIWPDRNALVKQTTAVVTVSVCLGAIITIIDAVMKYGIDLLVR